MVPEFPSTPNDGAFFFFSGEVPWGVGKIHSCFLLEAVRVSYLKDNLSYKYLYLDPPRGAKWMGEGAIKQPLRVESPAIGGCFLDIHGHFYPYTSSFKKALMTPPIGNKSTNRTA